jgi:multicomponent Na+:H+ antiporter subunit A
MSAPVLNGETFRVRFPWIPSLGVNLSFYVDGLGLLFALLISGIGLLVMLYASRYLAGHPYLHRFYAILLLFMISMLGVVLADNVLVLFIFWELTSVTSYLLIGFDHEKASSRAGAWQALLVTGAGGLAMLAGLLLLGLMAGTLELSQIITQGDTIRANSLYLPVLLLVALGAFTKSAQFPFHFWLPNAMEAPTPVSAYLHSATMVKAGVYLLARLNPALGSTGIWESLVTGTGAITMLTGAILAWQHTDLKRILAYSTISALGTLVMLLGIGTTLAVKAAMLFLLGHSLYKGALFMAAGAVDHEVGARDVTLLGGLGRSMKITALAIALAALSMSGLPPSIGFISKELLYETTLNGPVNWFLTGMAVLSNVFTIMAVGLIAVRPFWGRPTEAARHAHEAPLLLWLGPLTLAVVGLLAGLWPGMVGKWLRPSVAAILGAPAEVKLMLWHGINPMLILSVITVAAGVVGYAALGSIALWTLPLRRLYRWGPERWYEWLLTGLLRVARGQTRILQSGYLRYYILTIVLSTVLLAGFTLVRRSGLRLPVSGSGFRPSELAIAALILAATGMALRTNSRLAAVAALGVIGYSVALLYVMFGAPDLAMTQFAIETLTVILLVYVLYRLPRFANLSSRVARVRDVVAALLAGGLMSALTLAALSAPHTPHLTAFFAENSLSQAKGRNVVNVILVDFRGLDTLGEITVLAVAASGVFALLKLRLDDQRETVNDNFMQSRLRLSTILSTVTWILLPLMILFSFFVLLRGHNEPGGGFIAGLVVSAAFALYAMSEGVKRAYLALRLLPRRLIPVGLLLAGGSGLLAWLNGQPFMTGLWSTRELPVLGKIGTPLIFDLGVYLVVIGVTLTILFGLMES